MKTRNFLFGIVWLMSMSHAWADDFVISNVAIPQGGTADLVIGYNFTSSTDKVGFTLSMELPDGLSLLTDDGGDPVYVKDASIDKLNILFPSAGSVAGQPSTGAATIKGTSGTLLTLTLVVDASLEVGSVLSIPVTKATFQQRVEGSVTDINIPDFSYNVSIDAPEDGYLKFNETATTLPTYTAGGKGNVRMTRTIKKDQWNTIVLPFTLTKAKAEAVFGSDVELAEFAGFEVDYGDDDENVVPLGITINFSTYTLGAKKPLTGGKPFLIKTSKDITSFEAEDCSLVDAVTDVTKTDEFDTSGKFTGSFVKTKVPADGLFISDNKFYYSTGATNIKAFRGWFELGAVLDKETDFSVKMFIDGAETKVDGLSMKDATGTIYNISGRKIEKPQQRGIYIVNGKKMLKN